MASLSGLWYLAGVSKELRRGEMIRRILFNEAIVFGRMKDDAAFAYVDICPHRGAPLSAGCVSDKGIECPYHGWRFSSGDGQCLDAPALPNSAERISGLHLQKRHIAERNGLIWIYKGALASDGSFVTEPPDLGLDPALVPRTKTILTVECSFDEAVIGLVDPAHTPTVHQQWWWRKGSGRALKKKSFEPTALGFRMPPHEPSSNSKIYKLLGGAPTTEIEFRLPGLRFEWIRTKKRLVFGLTAMTPGEKGHVRINHIMFWDSMVFTLMTPIAQKMSDDFFGQDRAILEAQHLNLARGHHRPLFLGDADVPAQWYCQLKKAWSDQSNAPISPFENPLKAATLEWRT